MLHHHHARLVAADGGEDIVGVHQARDALRLTQRRHRFLKTSGLGEEDARERMNEREVAAISRRVQSRRGFGHVLANDRDVAHLAVGLAEPVMREADRTGVVGRLGIFQRTAVERDGTRLIAARRCQAAVQEPQCGQLASGDGVAKRIRRAPQGCGGLIEVVLHQPGFGQHRSDGEPLVSTQRGAQDRSQHLSGLGALAALEGGAGTGEQGLQGWRGHDRSIND